MLRLTGLLSLGIACLVLVVGTGTSGDKKDPKDGTKIKGQLPPGWKNLGLSKEQTSQIYMIQSKYKKKIMDLETQIKETKAQERKEMVNILTAEQKEALSRAAIGEDAPVKDKKAPPADKVDKKEKD